MGRRLPSGLGELALQEFSKILLIKLSAVGDVVHSIPVLNKLRRRYPAAQIDWLATPAIAELLRYHSGITNVVEFARNEWLRPWRWSAFASSARLAGKLNAVGYDLVIDLQASDVQSLEAKGKLKVISTPQYNAVTFVSMNNQIPPFDNINVRRAVAFALPYDDMFKAALFGRGAPLFGATWVDGKPSSGAYPIPQPVKLDLEKAKEYLKEAGLADGFSTTFSFNVGQASTAEPMAALVKESLAKIGIKVDIQKMPDAQMSTQINEKKLPFFTEGIVAWLPSTDYFYRNFYTGNQRWNYSSIDDPELVAIAQEARFEPDKAKYEEDGRKLNAIHFSEMPQIPLWQPNQDAVMAPSIEGYTYEFHRQVDYRDLSRK